MTEQQWWSCLHAGGDILHYDAEGNRLVYIVADQIDDAAAEWQTKGRRDVAGRLRYIAGQVRAGRTIGKRVEAKERKRLEAIAGRHTR